MTVCPQVRKVLEVMRDPDETSVFTIRGFDEGDRCDAAPFDEGDALAVHVLVAVVWFLSDSHWLD